MTKRTGIASRRLILLSGLGVVAAFLVLQMFSKSGEATSLSIVRRVESMFKEADSLELFSLDPISDNDAPRGRFSYYPVFGSVKISDVSERTRLYNALICEEKDMFARCFWPRHGVRATLDRRLYEAVICFECGMMVLYVDGDMIGRAGVNGLYGGKEANDIFNSPLEKAGITVNAPGGGIDTP